MNPRERGFLLLTSHLGDPERRPLTVAQFRSLTQRMQAASFSGEDRALETRDLVALGYSLDMAERISGLLEQEDVLDHYLRRGRKQGCIPISRVSEGYPAILRQRLGLDSPGCFWAKGDVSILSRPAVSLVGSRDLGEENRRFAVSVGEHAAQMGWTLISGNARGADRTAQEACLAAGGSVISIVADTLAEHMPRENLLYLSEESYDAAFSAQRALSRNRCIHAMGYLVFVAQCSFHKGGTWDGTVRNLRSGWSTVAVFRDGSEASLELEQMGAYLIGPGELDDFGALTPRDIRLF